MKDIDNDSLYGKFDEMVSAIVSTRIKSTFADFFCGIGGFHTAASNLGMECVFASDIDESCRKAYFENFGIRPAGDISKIKPSSVPDHDFLFGGFPCQPFSIIGSKKGFDDPRGTLFFDLLEIIKEKMPKAVVLENVKQLATAQKGKVIEKITGDLKAIGYDVEWKILNALDCGLPQKRERVIIVGIYNGLADFNWNFEKKKMTPLEDILETHPDKKHFVSDRIRIKRKEAHKTDVKPAIWHENKSGNISSHPYSCALRAGASYNYLLVDGERRLTPRETLRLQGFPDTYKIVCTDSQLKKQTGNAVPVPLVQVIIEEVDRVTRQQSEAKKTARSIKLPEWLWQWMDEQESTNRALLIESALIKLYELKEPIIKAAINDVRGVKK